MRTAILVCTAMATLSFGTVAPAQPVPGYVAAALADPGRPAADTQRDARRKPAECLALAGLKPGDRVADVYPGGGYYTRIFSKVVGPSGRVYALIPQVVAAQASGVVADTKAQFAGADYQNVRVLVAPFAALSAPEPLDLVWMGDVYHDLPNVEMGPADIAATNRAVFKALKPGGIYIVTDHAAAPGSNFLDLEPDMSRRLHRIDPAIVKRQVLAAGFVLEAQSDLLANGADPHTASVFDPAIRGKTDQFFFKFRKPR
ncbi:MAG TPA: hypothetical protein VK676_03010 [Steroidobacteraceae bacterium]|jgi:predicted methyltransferase|nr:hypothetical protein [Steroidobacteraceae bacterium]